MSTQLYLKDRLENAWNSSAHLRKLSLPMAALVSILMYPQFVQELYHYHTFNLGALENMIKLAAVWMGLALFVQCVHSMHSHPEEVWANPFLGIVGVIIFVAMIKIPMADQLSFMFAICLYEISFHVRQHIMEGLAELNPIPDEMRAFELLRKLLQLSYLGIIGGVALALNIATRIGHLL